MRLHCNKCGKTVSSEVPDNTVVRAWIECPECSEENSKREKGGIITIHSVEVVNPEFISKHMFPKKIPKEKRCK